MWMYVGCVGMKGGKDALSGMLLQFNQEADDVMILEYE